MLTFVSSPKPFKGIDKENQYRAIKSWILSTENAEVILYGDSAGIDQAGIDLGVKVVKDVASTESGLPYFGAIADHAAIHGKYDTQVYLNCDILLCNLHEAAKAIGFPKFLAIGQRIDLAAETFLDQHPAEYKEIINQLLTEGRVQMHETSGVDYFMFPRGLWNGVKQIVVGRGGYDNALLDFCKWNQYPIIDCTLSVIALHQFHDYSHVKGNRDTVFFGADAKQNIEAAGRYSFLSVADADYILDNFQLQEIACRGDYLRKTELKWRYHRKWKKGSLALRMVWRVLNAAKLIRKKELELAQLVQKGYAVFSVKQSTHQINE